LTTIILDNSSNHIDDLTSLRLLVILLTLLAFFDNLYSPVYQVTGFGLWVIFVSVGAVGSLLFWFAFFEQSVVFPRRAAFAQVTASDRFERRFSKILVEEASVIMYVEESFFGLEALFGAFSTDVYPLSYFALRSAQIKRIFLQFFGSLELISDILKIVKDPLLQHAPFQCSVPFMGLRDSAARRKILTGTFLAGICFGQKYRFLRFTLIKFRLRNA